MSEMFSDKWMKSFSTVWDADARITAVPENFGFKPIISYGFKGEKTPFGLAYISKKLQIIVGDCGAMMKCFRMAFPFKNEFAVMGKAQTK